jgi:transcriptional repressor NrdR
MKCPFCGGEETQVKDSRPTEDNTAIRRRRICNTCGGRYTTFERVQLRELMVLKRSGRRVPFDRENWCGPFRSQCASVRSIQSGSSAW